MLGRKRHKRKLGDTAAGFDPNEVFLDATNLPAFDTHQMEGKMEKPVSKWSLRVAGAVFSLVGAIFLWRIGELQIVRGAAMRERAEENRLSHSVIFANRGTLYDRNGVKLAWNSLGVSSIAEDGNESTNASGTAALAPAPNIMASTTGSGREFFSRAYFSGGGLSHLLGYAGYPAKDSSGVYYETEVRGMDGAEKKFNDILSGKNGTRIEEVDARGEIHSENVIDPPIAGGDVFLSIDSRVQEKLFESIADLAAKVDFRGGAGVLMDIETGEIIALTSFPEYRSVDLTEGVREKIAAYNADPRSPFINRAVHGLYTPGSIVKPFMAIAALNEGIISPEKQILSTGSISIPNPYFPDKPSVFKDWKAHGLVDMRRAIAVSSDVYFYEVGGGYQDQPGLGIARIKKYLTAFGFGEKTGIGIGGEAEGVIPDPEWKAKNFDGASWLLGNTYHTVIGQYGMQITPLQAVRAAAALASDGNLLSPTLLALSSSSTSTSASISTQTRPKTFSTAQRTGARRISISIPQNHFEVAKEGMRLCVTDGICQALNLFDINVAAKTGTAELGAAKDRVNSWVIGFFPYEKPKYAFAVVMENGPVHNLTGAVFAMRQVLEFMARETPEYLK